MEFKDHFKIGDKIKIGIHKGKKDVIFYESKIGDILEDRREIKVYNIGSIKEPVEISSGELISIVKELGSLVFFFNTIYLSKDNSKFDYLVIRLPSFIERMQRREFYRLPINVKIRLRKEGNEDDIYLGETLDLSGNGLSVDLDAPLSKDEKVIIDLPLTSDLYIDNIYGIVTRVTDGELLPYRYGIEFNNLEKEKKEKIVSYIFQIQRLRIKLEKGM